MKNRLSNTSQIGHRLRLSRLAVGVAVCFGISQSAYSSPNLQVTDCSDGSGAGTLRNVILHASNADTVEIKAGVCSKITVNTAAISIGVDDLSIVGPGQAQLMISGGYDATPKQNHSIFYHQGKGDLNIEYVTLAHAKYTGSVLPIGGCVYSAGNVIITHSTVTGCGIFTPSSSEARSAGGAIYAKGKVQLSYSTITGNSIINEEDEQSGYGAGIYAGNSLYAYKSTISHNVAYSPNNISIGGGAFVEEGNVEITQSTISYNSANYGGGLYGKHSFGAQFILSTFSGNSARTGSALIIGDSSDSSTEALFLDSTISGNQASFAAAARINMSANFVNSTIAFNRIGAVDEPAIYSPNPIRMTNSIFADNGTNDIESMATGTQLTGTNNLITNTPDPVPLGTISTCPKLEALADNGGLTLTHALQAASPAINAGDSSLARSNSDQRGKLRNIGGVDIGSYERQPSEPPDDRIFLSAFEGRCD
jgi:predicted outer membrane repeat protein